MRALQRPEIDNTLAPQLPPGDDRQNSLHRAIAEIDTIAAVVGCVVHGLGASIVPWNAIEEASGKLVAVPFGDPQMHRLIGLVERRASPRAAVIARLHQHS